MNELKNQLQIIWIKYIYIQKKVQIKEKHEKKWGETFSSSED